MAQVERAAHLQTWVEHDLEYLLDEWRDIPSVAAEWDEWGDHEQLNFAMEWPLREDRLAQLRLWAEQGVLTPAQRRRYDELSTLIAAYRPVVERLLRDVTGA